MKRIQILTTVFLSTYLLILIFTDFSFTGFWTDVIFTILLLTFSLIVVYRKKTDNPKLTRTLRSTALISSIVVFVYMLFAFANPFAFLSYQKMRHFSNIVVENRNFNAYFFPTGAYGRGYGSFRITESPKYFPIIEWTVYSEKATDTDFNMDKLEDTPIEDVVKAMIENEVIKKH